MNAVSICFAIVIEKIDKLNNKVITKDKLIDYLNSNEVIRYYAFILHDKDIDENGELIRPHWHLVIYLTRAFSKNTILGDIAKSLEINKNLISIMVGDIIESTCYLPHSEKSKKHVYSSLDIVTNDITNLNLILSKQTCNYFTSIDYLVSLVRKCKSRTEIFCIIGLKEAKLYRSIIDVLWADKMSGKLGDLLEG